MKNKESGSKSFYRIWFSCWWPVLLIVVLFLTAGTLIVHQIQSMLREEHLASLVDMHQNEFVQIQADYDREAPNNPEAAYESAVTALKWHANSGFASEDIMGVYLCNSRGEVVAKRENALYLIHNEMYDNNNSITRYYQCADKELEQRVLDAYEAWVNKADPAAPKPLLRIDEAYIAGNKCYPVRTNIYSADKAESQDDPGVYFHLQETITAEKSPEAENGLHLTGLDIVNDGDGVGEIGAKLSQAIESESYYATNINLWDSEIPELSEDMKKAIFYNNSTDNAAASDAVITYRAVSASSMKLKGTDGKTYDGAVIPVCIGSDIYYFVLLGKEHRGITTGLYMAWGLGILFSAFIALVIAKGFARIIRKEQELVCRQRDYTNALAHDLKTPLMAISGYTENLQANVNPANQKHYYEAIFSNIDYMNRLIMDMLSLARLQKTEGNLCKERIDLRNLTETVVTCFEQKLAEKNMDLKLEGSGFVDADPRLLERAFKNLVENAVKYSPEGESIRILLSDSFFQITNTGIILPDEKRNAVFQPYVKGDEVRERESGIGLGLAIVKDIAELHGFRCRLECTGQATTVTMEFSSSES